MLSSCTFPTLFTAPKFGAVKSVGKTLHKPSNICKTSHRKYIPNTTLSQALSWSPEETFKNLLTLISHENANRLTKNKPVESPLKTAGHTNSSWLQHTKVVGINVRAVGSYLNILKTAMIYPERGIHILPAYTTRDSLYSPRDWKLSHEFLDPYLSQQGFTTPKAQLAYVINALHAMGRVVGMDVLPHMSSFSNESLLNPDKFEWIRLDKLKNSQLYDKNTKYEALKSWMKDKVRAAFLRSQTSDNTYLDLFHALKRQALSSNAKKAEVYDQLQQHIARTLLIDPELDERCWSHFDSLLLKKAEHLSPVDKEVIQRFHEALNVHRISDRQAKMYFEKHLAILDTKSSLGTQVQLAIIDFLKREGDSQGYPVKNPETFFNLPQKERQHILLGTKSQFTANETPELRRMAVIQHLRKQGFYPAPVQDGEKLRPIIFDRIRPNEPAMAVFDKPNIQPPYKHEFFSSLSPFAFYPVKPNGYLNTAKPNWPVFDYFANHIVKLNKSLGLDFIRADMAHLQIAHATDTPVEKLHEVWSYVKQLVQKQTPYFGVWGESFLMGPRSIDIVQDLNNKKLDIVTGNVDRLPVNANFIDVIESKTRAGGQQFKEMLSVVTHDSDQRKYRHLTDNPLAIVSRYFFHLFQDNPGYSMAGFETSPASFAHDYIFKQPQAFDWGQDTVRFRVINSLRKQYEGTRPDFSERKQEWLISNNDGVGGWIHQQLNSNRPSLLFVANTDIENRKDGVCLSNPVRKQIHLKAECLHSTAKPTNEVPTIQIHPKQQLVLGSLAPGENRIYKFVSA